jgi:hypothetical protein
VLRIPQLKQLYDVRDSLSGAVYPPKKIGTHPVKAIFGKKYVYAMHFFKKYQEIHGIYIFVPQNGKESKIQMQKGGWPFS